MKTTAEICSSMALIFVCVSMFASMGLAHNVPPPPPPPPTPTPTPTPGGLPDVQKCWSSLESIEGCAVEIYRSFFTGKIQSVGPACCKAFAAVDEACWPKMFPFNPFFPPLLKSCCAINGGGVAAIASASTLPPTPKTDEENLPFVGFLPPGPVSDIHQCWSSLQSIEGCVNEIIQAFLSGEIRPLGPACCKAIVAVNEGCWPNMFPFNPFFPPLLKSYCAINGGSGAPTATPLTTTPTVGSTTTTTTTKTVIA